MKKILLILVVLILIISYGKTTDVRAEQCSAKQEEARKILSELGWIGAASATCQQITDHVCGDCTIFVRPNDIREALCPPTSCPLNSGKNCSGDNCYDCIVNYEEGKGAFLDFYKKNDWDISCSPQPRSKLVINWCNQANPAGCASVKFGACSAQCEDRPATGKCKTSLAKQSPSLSDSCVICINNQAHTLAPKIRELNRDLFAKCSDKEVLNYWCNGGISQEATDQCQGFKNGACAAACGSNPSPTPSVSPTPSPDTAVTTKSFRIAENPADLNTAVWSPYTEEGMTETYDFKSIGQKFIFVQFMDSNGKTTTAASCPTCQAKIQILGPDPVITGCSLSSQGSSILLNLNGANFGSSKGVVKNADSALQIKQWKDDNIQAVLSSPPVGESLPVIVTNADGQSSPESLCSAVSVLNIGASFFCHAPQDQSQTNLDLTLVEQTPGAKLFRQKVDIDKDGTIQGLTGILQEGHNYKISLKAPESVRKTSDVFTATAGSTTIPNFILPVGDIFPLDSGDGVINSLDKAELNREWIIAADGAGRKGDFNKDGRVNSIDWACMRNDVGSSNDAEPTASLSI